MLIFNLERFYFACIASLISTILYPSVSLSSAAESKTMKGRLQLWESNICADSQDLCELPKALGPAWTVEQTFEIPLELGKHKLIDLHEQRSGLRVRFQYFIVKVPAPQISYFIQQITLTKLKSESSLENSESLGPIALCSRLDAIEAFPIFFPPGACSGRWKDKLFGISVSTPQ